VTSSDLCDALRKHYDAREWALLFNVRNTTGASSAVRCADAVAMNLWPSRGLEVHGFELKVSRSDWLAEKKRPEKAEAIAGYCDRWWLVVSDEAIVQLGELPPTWGLLHIVRGRLVVKVEAPRLEPRLLDRRFIASMLRSAMRGTDDERIRERETQRSDTEAALFGEESDAPEPPEDWRFAWTPLKEAATRCGRNVDDLVARVKMRSLKSRTVNGSICVRLVDVMGLRPGA
jgi:hypothetical protein